MNMFVKSSAVVASAAAATALPELAKGAAADPAAPPIAPTVLEASEADPIRVAIARHQALDELQYSMWCRLQEMPVGSREQRELHREHECASGAAHEAAEALWKVRPTTAAGAVDLFLYVGKDCSPVGQEPWHTPTLVNAAEGYQGATAGTVPALRTVAEPDAGLKALGEKLKAATAEAERLRPDHRLYEEAWEASGLDKHPEGRAHKVALRRLQEAQERNGYNAASKEWNAACDVQRSIARAILKMKAHTRIGDGVRAAAEIADGDGIYLSDSTVLWESAARAGFQPPDDIAKQLKRNGQAPRASRK